MKETLFMVSNELQYFNMILDCLLTLHLTQNHNLYFRHDEGASKNRTPLSIFVVKHVKLVALWERTIIQMMKLKPKYGCMMNTERPLPEGATALSDILPIGAPFP